MNVLAKPHHDAAVEDSSTCVRLAVYLADQNPHRDRSLGITSMTGVLLDHFASRGDLSLTQVISESSYKSSDSRIATHRIPIKTDRTLGRLVADAGHPWFARPDVDLWYYPKGYVSTWAKPFQRCVGTMHDTIVQHYADHYPQTRSGRAFGYWIGLTKRSLSQLSCVLTISENAADQLRAFCDRYSIDPPPIEITYEGSSWESVRTQRVPKEDCVIHLASASPHKASNRLLGHWKVLQDRGRELPRLDLVGSLDAAGEQLASAIVNTTRQTALPIERLQRMVGRSRALLLPSEIEGFGLPALEAYYVGTPTCYVRDTSVDEVVQGQGRAGQFDLADVDDFERSLDWALGLPESTIDEVSDAMYAKFSNQQIADRIVTAFKRVATM